MEDLVFDLTINFCGDDFFKRDRGGTLESDEYAATCVCFSLEVPLFFFLSQWRFCFNGDKEECFMSWDSASSPKSRVSLGVAVEGEIVLDLYLGRYFCWT